MDTRTTETGTNAPFSSSGTAARRLIRQRANSTMMAWAQIVVRNSPDGPAADITTPAIIGPKIEPMPNRTSRPPLSSMKDESAAFGLNDMIDDRAGAAGDMDGDGDLDLFVAPTAGRLRYFENQLSTTNGSILLDITTGTSAPGGVGSVVQWTDSQGNPHTRWVGSDAPTASQNDQLVHFGIGAETSVDLEVDFPSGMHLTLSDVLPYNGVSPQSIVEPEMIRLSTRSLSIPLAALPGEPDEVTVTAFAYAQDGTALDGTALVTIDAGSLVPTGPVQHVAGNEFQRTFEGAATQGSHRVEVSFDGWVVEIRPVVHITGLMSAVRSLVRTIPSGVRAASGETFIVDVAPRDNASRTIGPGHPVVVDLVGAGQETAVDLGNGLYRATFTAPLAPGSYDIDISVQGLPLDGPVMEVAGACDGAVSDLLFFSPLPAQSATPNQLKLLFTPRDAQGRRLGPLADVELILASAPVGRGSLGGPGGTRSLSGAGLKGPKPGAQVPFPGDALTIRHDLTVSRDDGSFLFVIEKPMESEELPSGVFTLLVGGTPVRTELFHFDPTK